MQQLAALVVAHGFDVHIGSRCQAADRERVWTHSLTPYPGTEISMPGCKQLPLNLLFRPSLARASPPLARPSRSEEHTSEVQSLMRISYAVFCLKKKITTIHYSANLQQT